MTQELLELETGGLSRRKSATTDIRAETVKYYREEKMNSPDMKEGKRRTVKRKIVLISHAAIVSTSSSIGVYLAELIAISLPAVQLLFRLL